MFEALIPRFPDYELIDSGDFEKLERFGRYVVRRPEPQAIWRRTLSEEEWRRAADASFLRDTRSEERGEWRLVYRDRFRSTGGRERGFRGYSWVLDPKPGDWRFIAATQDGRTIGLMQFRVERGRSDASSRVLREF